MVPAYPTEPELAGPIPRAVRYRDGWAVGCGMWFVRLFILPHTLAGVFMLGLAVWSTAVYLGVWLFGEEYPGAVVQKVERPGSKGRTTYTVEYEYTVAGRVHTGRASLSQAEYQ